MQTQRIMVDRGKPDIQSINEAARVLKSGGVVAFPTETVYGLGAIAADEKAVSRIFAAKDRPPANPLIVHVSRIEQARELAREWTPEAEKLAKAFWPGPLTLVLPAVDAVPSLVRGGGETVGIRMPAHTVALALIEAAAPLAAPSANRSGRPSPRTGAEVWEDLAGRIPLLLDAGPTPGGLESTVLDLSSRPYRILRLGGTPRPRLEEVLGEQVISTEENSPAAALPHYQASARVFGVYAAELETLWGSLQGKKVALVVNNNQVEDFTRRADQVYRLQTAGELFSILRQAEKDGIEALILVKDAGLPWDEALESRVAMASRSSNC